MKKSLFPLLLVGMLASCSDKEPVAGNEVGGNQEEVINKAGNGYLSIRLVAPGDLYGRANGSYMYGEPAENFVTNVRFFFFTEGGEPAYVRKNPIYGMGGGESELQYFSYYDWNPTSSENGDYVGQYPDTETDPDNGGNLGDALEGDNGTVEKILNSMLVMNFPEDEETKAAHYPEYVVAIINPTTKILTLENPKLDVLLGSTVEEDFTQYQNNNFVMSNSVYIDKDGFQIVAQKISEDNLQPTQVAAQDHQLVIFVERTVARFDQTLTIAPKPGEQAFPVVGGVTLYPTGFVFNSSDRQYDDSQSPSEPGTTDPADGPEAQAETPAGGVPVYAKFLGWAVTSDPVRANLIKNISTEWGDDDAVFDVVNQPWYISSYHRSFWGMNPASMTRVKSNYKWFTFNQISGENNVARTGFPMSVTKTYMQENANPYSSTATLGNPQEPTKIIYAAQIVNAQGEPMEIAEWNGLYFTQNGLKEMAAHMLDMFYDADAANADQEGHVPQWTRVSKDQLTFMTKSEFFDRDPIFQNPEKLNYLSYLTLTSSTTQNTPTANAAGLVWYHRSGTVNADGKYTYTKITGDIEDYIESTFGPSMVWNNGYTYYYYEIRHLGNPEATEEAKSVGKWGVVRNHAYNANVKGLTGLGTPVWDPNEEIYPEHPDHEGNNMSAQVDILMWRIVAEDYEFDW